MTARLAMAEREETVVAARFWRWLRIVGLSLVAVFLVGVAGGFLAARAERGAAIDLFTVAFLAADALLLAGCVWLILRDVRRPTGEEPLTRKERLNRNILIGSGALGGAMGVLMVLAVLASGQEITPGSVLSSAPLPTGVALLMMLVLGVVVPALSIYWHRSAVDEQEADAYKTGALWGIYVFMIGAPLWWFAWRGGFAPEPNGIAIYFATVLTVGVIWIWKKYR
ncbi:hypothetical protein [Sphingosinicella sp. YJ22]|uniref:hypothetical protein n=1 Tax=Sphingosinicella sp. YJ22 TaxID=1104780 RepID=UPI001408D6DF|nr:hypothetical protein [Sphingosinicella sp. YJ22]